MKVSIKRRLIGTEETLGRYKKNREHGGLPTLTKAMELV
jgi:hypothetical protein